MIGIVDYGLGNIQSFVDIYKKLNIPVLIARTAEDLESVERLILPGVGAFDWAMERLEVSGMKDKLDELVLVKKRPVLGVCVGMQIMARRSDEGAAHGLGWIRADVKRFDRAKLDEGACLPHMGWNDATPVSSDCLFEGIENPRFYFLHSYYFTPDRSDEVLATTVYGDVFASAVRSDNIWGTQFHPEKSHHWGVRVLKNFGDI